MVDKKSTDRCEIFEDTIRNALNTERAQHFRLCVDEKDNISIASGSASYSNLSGAFVPACPSDTKKTLEVVITPVIEKYKLPYLE